MTDFGSTTSPAVVGRTGALESADRTPPAALTGFDWRPIPSAPGYFASSDGQIRGLKGFSLKFGRGEYPTVTVCKDGAHLTRRVHSLVCEAFHGPRPSSEHQACHWDGLPSNCAASNLRWDTQSGNIADAKRHGTWHVGSNNWHTSLVEDQVAEIKRVYIANRPGKYVKRGTITTVWRIRCNNLSDCGRQVMGSCAAMSAIDLTENEIQRALFKHIKMRGAPGVFAFHPKNGGVHQRGRRAGINTGLGVIPGVPDVIIFSGGSTYAIELKTRKGKVSDDQMTVLASIANTGVKTFIAFGLEAAIAWLEEHGILKGRMK